MQLQIIVVMESVSIRAIVVIQTVAVQSAQIVLMLKQPTLNIVDLVPMTVRLKRLRMEKERRAKLVFVSIRAIPATPIAVTRRHQAAAMLKAVITTTAVDAIKNV